MISEFKFYSELNFSLKNKESFVAFKNPSHKKIICYKGEIISGTNNQMSDKRGFIFMPFDSTDKGYLLIPKNTFETEFHANLKIDNNYKVSAKDFTEKKKHYINYVKTTIRDINSSSLEKVVCSSSFGLKINPKSVTKYFQKLLQLNDGAFCYLFFNPSIGIWMGASPEKLINLNNGLLTTYALAATKKELSQNWTDKEFREQKIVEEQIIDDLNSSCDFVENGPLQTIKAGDIYHLKSVIKAKTTNSSFDLINLLHPTPAVAGSPRNKAIDYINKIENYDRSFYTGYMGVIDQDYCDVYVNIRCAKIVEDDLTIYVGGGITKESKPIDEWSEIVNKSQTMLRVFHQD